MLLQHQKELQGNKHWREDDDNNEGNAEEKQTILADCKPIYWHARNSLARKNKFHVMITALKY